MVFLAAIDNSSLWLVQDLFRCSLLDSLMPVISALGNGGGIWVLMCIILLCRRSTRPTGLAMGIAMLACFLSGNLLLKNLVARARPYTNDPTIQLLIPPSRELYSFPSGHAMNAFAAATVLMIRRQRFCWAAITLAALIAFSRVYLMMHYPLDVGMGMAIGIFAAIVSCRVVKYYEQRQRFRIKLF